MNIGQQFKANRTPQKLGLGQVKQTAGQAQKADIQPQSNGPMDRLPDLSLIAQRAEATSTPGKEAKPESGAGESGWGKTGMAVMAGVVGLTALAGAAPAEAGDIGVYFGTDGFGIQYREYDGYGNNGYYGNNGNYGNHGNYGNNGNYGHRGNYGHAPAYEAYGIDGQPHVFDNYGHVNDHTGHYNLQMDGWGNIFCDYNVNY